jgi:hypothetical protein
MVPAVLITQCHGLEIQVKNVILNSFVPVSGREGILIQYFRGTMLSCKYSTFYKRVFIIEFLILFMYDVVLPVMMTSQWETLPHHRIIFHHSPHGTKSTRRVRVITQTFEMRHCNLFRNRSNSLTQSTSCLVRRHLRDDIFQYRYRYLTNRTDHDAYDDEDGPVTGA